MQRLTIMLVALFAPALALGGVSGTYAVSGGQSLELSYRDNTHMRMDITDGQFVLVNGDDTFMVRRQGGQWLAMDLSAMGRMMQRMGRGGGESESGTGASAFSYQDTGRTETVAGYEGSVHAVTGPQGEKTEVVLSDHEDIIQLSHGWVRLSGKLAEQLGMMTDSIQKKMLSPEEIDRRGGILRIGDELRLQSVSTEDRGQAHYELPEGTQVRDIAGGAPPGP